MTDNLRGALYMMAAMAALTVNDSCMKSLSDELPLFQAVFLRGVATSCLLTLLAYALGGLRLVLPRRDLGLIALRSVADIGTGLFLIAALFNMPLANVTAILQVAPLAVSLAGALVLREPLGWRRLTAILVGFGGVLLIVRPGTDGFDAYSVYALLSVCCITVRDLTTRRMSAVVPSMTVAVSSAVMVTLAGGVGMLATRGWTPVTGPVVWQLSGAVVFVMLGYVFSVLVMRVGELGFTTPFRYTALIWALLLGWAVFGEWPQPLTLLGAAIVVGTGVFTLYRERHARPGVPPPLVPR